MGGFLLDGKRQEYFWMDPRELTIAGIDTDDGPEHRHYDPRIVTYWDAKKKKSLIDDATIANYRLVGVRDAVEVDVEVVKTKGEDGKEIIKKIAWVVDGRRRTLGARVANEQIEKENGKSGEEPLLRVKVMAERNMDEKLADLVKVSKNRFRQNDSVMMSAEQAQRLKARGHTKTEIAAAMGVDDQTVDMYLAVTGLDARVRKAIDDERISPSAAAKLAGLTKEEQNETLQKLLAEAAETGEKRVTVRSARAAAKSKKRGKDHVAVPPRRVLRRAIVDNKEAVEILSEDFIRGVRFAIGDLKSSSVKGLTDLVHQASPKKRAAAAE